jgi:hypothetical protein
MIIINYDYLFKLFIRCSLNHDDYMVYYIYLYLQSTVLNNVSRSKTKIYSLVTLFETVDFSFATSNII